MFGTWPLPEFRKLTPEQQREFYLAQANDTTGLKQLIEDHLIARLVEIEMAKEAGEFRPLDFWIQKGYNGDRVKANAPKRWCPMGGEVYQVMIMSTSFERRREMIQEQLQKLYKRGGVNPGSGDGASLAIAEGDADGDADGGANAEGGDNATDDSSSSSSDSDDKKKKKKKKKAKKASKKAKKNAKEANEKNKASALVELKKKEKENVKLERNRIAKVKAECSRVIAKTGPVLENLRNIEKDTKFLHIPKVLQKKTIDGRKAFLTYRAASYIHTYMHT